jgi:bifunctional non-homologous end joining protein LigD
MSLAEYRRKREFGKTREPAGKVARRRTKLSFVVQHHFASREHYDFRLELDGVLKSWAVPKGPSTKRGERRLAVEVEDHPLGYAKFEGTIPQGEYGAGKVFRWDWGTWEPTGDRHEGLEKGSLSFVLSGRKLKGAWTLTRMRDNPKQRGKHNWLLIKRSDAPVARKKARVMAASPSAKRAARRRAADRAGKKPARARAR